MIGVWSTCKNAKWWHRFSFSSRTARGTCVWDEIDDPNFWPTRRCVGANSVHKTGILALRYRTCRPYTNRSSTQIRRLDIQLCRIVDFPMFGIHPSGSDPIRFCSQVPFYSCRTINILASSYDAQFSLTAYCLTKGMDAQFSLTAYCPTKGIQAVLVCARNSRRFLRLWIFVSFVQE
jgi:hypothetical protein